MIATSPDLFRAGRWRVDSHRSKIGFFVRHFGVRTVHGRFSIFGAALEADGDRIWAGGHVDVASVDTGDAVRDRRLRDEFFDAERFPAMTFRGCDVVTGARGRTVVTGELTIRDVTRPVSLELTTSSPDDGDEIHVQATGELSRSDFGLEWDALREAGKLLVADRVKLALDLVVERATTEV